MDPHEIDMLANEVRDQPAATPAAGRGRFPWQGLHPHQAALHSLPKLPPSNDKAEMVLLGTLMANNLAAKRMGTFLKVEHFSDPVNAAIFGAVMRRIGAGQMADLVTLTAEFEHSGKLDEVGGTDYLRQLVTQPGPVIDPLVYAISIADTWLRRQVIDLSERAMLAAEQALSCAFGSTDADLSAAENADRLQDRLGNLIGQMHVATLSASWAPTKPVGTEPPL